MTNKKTSKTIEQPSTPKAEPINEGFYDMKDIKLVPKVLHDNEHVDNIARELNAGRVYVFAKNMSRNGQYNVRKKLKKLHPELKFAQGIIEATQQDVLYKVQ